MNLATWSIRNPVPVILLFILLTIAGLYGFSKLPIQDQPDITFPGVNITLTLPGASPIQLEQEVARKVENKIVSLSGFEHIDTTISSGMVYMRVSFARERSTRDALVETKDAIDSIITSLPKDLDPPVIKIFTSTDDPIARYTVTSKRMNIEALSWFVDDTINKTLLSVNGVGKVARDGGVEREIRVEVDPTKLAAIGVTTADISRSLKQIQIESSGGQAQIGDVKQTMRTLATIKKPSDLNAMPIALSDGRRVRLDEVATILDTYDESGQAALLDNKPTVGFSIYRAKGYDQTLIMKEVREQLAILKSNYQDLNITILYDSTDAMIKQYNGSMQMLYEGALLAVIVVFLFLRNWRATLISATALPLSIIPTFAIMFWFSFVLDYLTLLALAVVVGILVDDAIVEIENIIRHQGMGKTIFAAAEDAINEIALAVTATTFTIVAVFLPIAFISGVLGLYFRPFGWTVVIAVLASLLVARLLTPVLAVYFLKTNTHEEKPDGFFMTKYLKLVHWCLLHRKTTVVLAILFFLGSIYMGTYLPTEFQPKQDSDSSEVRFELPPGTTTENTLEMARLVSTNILKLDGVAHVFTTINSTHNGEITVMLKPRKERSSQAEIETQISNNLATIPGARFKIGSQYDNLVLILASDNIPVLNETLQNLQSDMRSLKFFNTISSSASMEQPEIIIRPNAARAAELGVTTQTISDTIRIATAGDLDPQLSTLNLDNRQIYIRVRMPSSVTKDINAIADLRIPTKEGQTALSTIADISLGTGIGEISRKDRSRYVSIEASLSSGTLAEAYAEVMQLPALKKMHPDVKLIQGGNLESQNELFSSFWIAILTGIICVFCVLVLLFKDFYQPVTILSALPLSIGGALIALYLAKHSISLPVLIGIIMLIGIVTKNSILLVEYAILSMTEHDMNRFDAVIDACHKRARPIGMTTLAMIAGMLPIALGLGDNAGFQQPMAIAVIGGLSTSTALSLIVVPVVFTYIHGFEIKIQRLFGHKKLDFEMAQN